MAIGILKKITGHLLGKDSDAQRSAKSGGTRKSAAKGEGDSTARSSSRTRNSRGGGVPGIARPSRQSEGGEQPRGTRGRKRGATGAGVVRGERSEAGGSETKRSAARRSESKGTTDARATDGKSRGVRSAAAGELRLSKSEGAQGRRARGKRRSVAVSQAAAELQESAAQQYPAKGVERQVARPSRKKRGEGRRGGSDGERQNTPTAQRRPGGAVAETELVARSEAHEAWSLDQYKVAPFEGKTRFHDLNLPLEIMHAVHELGFEYCTPIQALSLEHALAGKNVAGRAQTGTGKTAAFLVAILTRYLRTPEERQMSGGAPRALVLAPTRELVIQICKDADALGKYCGLRSLAVYGGMDYDRQRREVSSEPVDLLVATPGRLLDFVRTRVVDLSKVDTLVIDEADRMLDMGFIPDVRSIIYKLPPKNKRATMLYSATLSEDVMRLAAQWMESPVRVEVESEQVATKTVSQLVYVVRAREKFTVLYNHIQKNPESRMLVFCNRRSTTDDVAHSLNHRGIKCEVLSGDVNQNRRLRVLEDFRAGKIRIVVATDVAGRGIHVDEIGYVINFDFPYEPEDYVHRIGRTGRAGAKGVAISFADEDESFIIPEIEEFLGEELKCILLNSDDELLKPLPPRPRIGRSGSRAPRESEPAVASEPVSAPEPAPRSQERQEQRPAPRPASRPAPRQERAAPAPRQQERAVPTPPRQERSAAPRQQERQERSYSNRRHVLPPPPPRPMLGPKAVYSEEWVPGE